MAAIPDPSGPRGASGWRQQVSTFWRWWSGELARMVPERFAALGGAARVPRVAFEGDDLVLAEPGRPSGADTRVSTAQDPQRARSMALALLERAGETRGRARLVLREGDALVRRTTMPAATEENLAQVLAFEMDRLTPFRSDEVYFDYRVVGRDPGAGTIGVLLAVARREVVDRDAARLRSLGITVEGILPRQEIAQASGALNLMPAEQRGERETPRERALKLGLAAVAGLLLLAVLFYPPWTKRRAIIALHPVEARAQGEAQAASRLAQELERLVADYNFLLAKKHGAPPALAYIEEVSRLLPDNTWVQQLELKPSGKTRELQLTGETASSSKLIEILEQSTLLRNAAARGTETRGSQPNTVRFMIAAEARPRQPPDAVPVAQLGTPVAPAPAAPAAPPKAAAPAKSEAKPAPAKLEPVPPPKPAADPKAPKPAQGK